MPVKSATRVGCLTSIGDYDVVFGNPMTICGVFFSGLCHVCRVFYSCRKHVRVFWQKSSFQTCFILVLCSHFDFDMNNSKPDLFIVVEFIYLVIPGYRIYDGHHSYSYPCIVPWRIARLASSLGCLCYHCSRPIRLGTPQLSRSPHYILRVVQTQQFFWEIFYLYRICVFKLNLFFLVRCVVKLCIIISGFVVVLWFNLPGGAQTKRKKNISFETTNHKEHW